MNASCVVWGNFLASSGLQIPCVVSLAEFRWRITILELVVCRGEARPSGAALEGCPSACLDSWGAPAGRSVSRGSVCLFCLPPFLASESPQAPQQLFSGMKEHLFSPWNASVKINKSHL